MPCCKNSLGLTWCSIFMKASNSSMKASVSLLLIDSASSKIALSQICYRMKQRMKPWAKIATDICWEGSTCMIVIGVWSAVDSMINIDFTIYRAAFQIHIYTHCLIFNIDINIFIWRERENDISTNVYAQANQFTKKTLQICFILL